MTDKIFGFKHLANSRKLSQTADRKILVWFCVVIFIMVASILLAYRATRTLIENERRVAHTQDIIFELNETLSAVKDAETGQRGFLLTSVNDYLEPYNKAVSNIEDNLKRIDDLTDDGSVQDQNLKLLRQKVSEKLAELAETIRLRQQSGPEAALQVVLSGKGRETMEEIRQIIGTMQVEENRQFQARTDESERSATQAIATFWLTGLLSAAMLGLFYNQIRKNSAERNKLLTAEQSARLSAENAYQEALAARNAAENANRLKDEFLATVSHELRTPLNSILGWATMLRRSEFDPATTNRALETIERNARSQAQLIEDLLDVSRIVSGKLRLDVRPLELAPIIEAAIEAVHPAAEAKQIVLRQVIDSNAGTVSGDSERLQQVIWNLLTNAIKFSPKNGKVELRLERVGSFVQIVVKDSGKGIEPEFLPHVFEVFRQAEGQITRAEGGLGLGLAIVNKIVEMHGGSVKAESAGENQGATFTVQLPIRGVNAAETLLPDNTRQVHPAVENGNKFHLEKLPSLTGLSILAVDDQLDTLEMIETVLTRSGATVITARSAQEALAQLQTWLPNILVADIGMPDEDGFSLIQKVRKLSVARGGKTPAVALTAFARVEDRLKTLSTGFQMHVPKPVEPAELVVIIASLAGRTATL